MIVAAFEASKQRLYTRMPNLTATTKITLRHGHR